jgi:hypothetical protein
MSFWTAMVVMVAIAGFTSMRVARYRAGLGDPPSRRGMVSGPIIEALSSTRESELQKEIDNLRQRVAVLERIATEDRHSKTIADEIENLRDR